MNPKWFARWAVERFCRFGTGMAIAIALAGLLGCRHAEPQAYKAGLAAVVSEKKPEVAAVAASSTKPKAPARRFNYTPRPYPVDERGFSPVDKALAKAYAREETIADDADEAHN